METKRARAILKVFYDTYGWKKDESSGRYLGEILHENLSKTAQRYMNCNEMRYQRYFGLGGLYFLDAGCGAEPRQKLSKTFRKHVCVDISLVGLKEARKQLGNYGLYVKADLSNLPFKDKTFDGTLAAHCLYHIDKDTQSIVLKELYRVTKADKNILIFYASDYNLISIYKRIKGIIIKLARSLFKYKPDSRQLPEKPPPIYYYTHNPIRLVKEFDLKDVSCLRILTKHSMDTLQKLHLLKLVIPIFYFLETPVQ